MGRHPVPSKAEIHKLGTLISRYRERGALDHPRAVYAVNRLVRGNLRLVVMIWSRKFSLVIPNNDPRLPDLLQEGAVGLQRAAQLFDPAKGYEFSTYAPCWIRKGFSDFLRRQNRTVYLPAGAARAARVFREIMDREPVGGRSSAQVIEEVAAICRTSTETTRKYLRQVAVTATLRLSAMNPTEDGPEGLDVAAPPEPSLVETERRQQLLEDFDLLAARAQLDPHERVLLLAQADGAGPAELKSLQPDLSDPLAHLRTIRRRLRKAGETMTAPASLSVA